MIKNSYLPALVAFIMLIGIKAEAQTDEDGVRAVILELFEGMKKGDSTKVRSAFSSQAIMQTIVKNRDGKLLVRTEPVDSFVAFVARPHNEVYDERISFESIRIDGDLASVWTPYQFYLGSKFSHCGVNSFQLIKNNGHWKIQYIIDTRRRQGCSE